METKQDQILDCVLKIQQDLGQVNGHLKQLNGSVARNVTDIKENRDDLKTHDKRMDEVDIKLAKFGGALVVVFVLVQGFFKFAV